MRSFPFSLLILCGLATPAAAQRAPLVPGDVMGTETCRDCHEEQVLEWEVSAHARPTVDPVASEEAVAMVEILGMTPQDIPRTASCVRCHFTPEILSGVPTEAVGVSCESCHGAAADWIDLHNTKGRSRSARVDDSIRHGMVHPASIYAVSKACFECHVIDDEQLVNGAGHPALSEGFEILSWYSGEVNHNFLVDGSDGLKDHADHIQPIPRPRKRMLFLNGKLLHLGFLLRGIAGARDAPVDRAGAFLRLDDGEYTYAVQLALEARRIVAEMEELATRVTLPAYIEAIALVQTLRFETGSGPDFAEAADSIFRIAEEFCREHDGSGFGSIDPVIDRLEPRYSDAAAADSR